MIKLGHRGARGHEPENTLRSFKKALQLGASMIECDVHLCKTGEVVVIHDEGVERTTNGTGKVADKTLEELKKLDAGEGEKIPTLEEVLDLVKKRCKVAIELKGPGTAKPVCRIIENYVEEKGWVYGDFFILSFEKAELEHFRKCNPDVPLVVLYRKIPEDFADYAVSLRAVAVAMFYGNTTKKHIDKAHSKGLKVIVWTVNEKEDIEKFKKLGVDGIGSDFPEQV